MKSFRSKVWIAALLCLTAAISGPVARAQTTTPPPPPRPAATPAEGRSASTSGVVLRTDPQLSGPMLPPTRERRAQAYAKLMAGQRYLATLTRANMNDNVKLARQAFQEAATLDPTLAEAHTALAFAAFHYPPYDFDESAREAAIAVRINRNNFGAQRLLSRVYAIKSGLRESNLNQGFVEKAVVALREVVRLQPNDAEGWALLGEYYFQAGRYDEAIDALTRWAAAPASIEPRFYQAVTNGRELSPDAAAARLSQALMRAGRYAEAATAIRRALYLEPDNKEYLEILTQALASGGTNDSAAINELQRMSEANPSNLTTVRTLARALARAGRVDDAAATLRSALMRKSVGEDERLQLRVELATILSDALRYADAVNVYEELLKDRGVTDAPLTSDEEREAVTEILQRIVNLQRYAGLEKEALGTVERMRRVLGREDPTADLTLIDMLRSQGKRREALAAAQAARKSYPQQLEFLRLEAQALTDLGRVDEGIAILRERMKGSIQDFDLYLTISALYTQAGRGREGVEAARKALELAPANQKAYANAALITMASAQESSGDTKGSEESLRRVLAADPNNATALNNLGYFLVERNERLEEALGMIQKAVNSDPTNSSFLDSLGWAYFKLGKLDDAERSLTEAARRDPTSSTVQEHLGDLYQKRGKTVEARAAWQKALALSTEPDETARIKAKLGGKTK